MSWADELLKIAQKSAPSLELKYNKFYIGLSRDGQPFNFVAFGPRKNHIILELKLPQSEETSQIIDATGFETLEHNRQAYKLSLTKTDIAQKADVLADLIKRAYEQRAG